MFSVFLLTEKTTVKWAGYSYESQPFKVSWRVHNCWRCWPFISRRDETFTSRFQSTDIVFMKIYLLVVLLTYGLWTTTYRRECIHEGTFNFLKLSEKTTKFNNKQLDNETLHFYWYKYEEEHQKKIFFERYLILNWTVKF